MTSSSVWVWGARKDVSENSTWTCRITRVEQSPFAGESPLVSSLSSVLCTSCGTIYLSRNNRTPLLRPDYELLWKAACRGALTLYPTAGKACPSNTHCPGTTRAQIRGSETREEKGALKKRNGPDPGESDYIPMDVFRGWRHQSKQAGQSLVGKTERPTSAVSMPTFLLFLALRVGHHRDAITLTTNTAS